MNILLVEPDRILGQAMQTALEAFGYNVARQPNAQVALDELDRAMPDLVIVELQLGLHNGIEFLYEMRSYTEWQHIPAIVHTLNAKAQDPAFSKAFEGLGVQAVLYKPRTTTSQLIRMVKQLVPVS